MGLLQLTKSVGAKHQVSRRSPRQWNVHCAGTPWDLIPFSTWEGEEFLAFPHLKQSTSYCQGLQAKQCRKIFARTINNWCFEGGTNSFTCTWLQWLVGTIKKSYQDLLEEMKAIQGRIESEQRSLQDTSTSYMNLVNSAKPDFAGLPEAVGGDPVPAAVAGFINTLGVSLTEDRQLQLQNMQKRPPADSDEEAKRRPG